MRIALGVEYNGSGFCGWQVQDRVRTVQAEVEAALSKVANHPVSVICAGRTDTGVHAFAQVIHMDSDADRTMRAWVFGGNANLPPDVALRWAKAMPAEFHARFSALQRHYRYVIFNRPTRSAVWPQHSAWFCRPLEVDKMREAAQHLLGEHDFSAFRAQGCQAKQPVRTITRLDLQRHGDEIHLSISANAFLQHMVRNITGTLVAVGDGSYPPSWVKTVLETRDRSRAGVTAPPSGLYFCGVDYPPIYGLDNPVIDLSLR